MILQQMFCVRAKRETFRELLFLQQRCGRNVSLFAGPFTINFFEDLCPFLFHNASHNQLNVIHNWKLVLDTTRPPKTPRGLLTINKYLT